jgi:hypothetical protein
MMKTALVIVFAFFYYQGVLVVASFAAHMIGDASANRHHWQLVYWLVCLIGVNIFSMIMYHV